MYWSHLEIDGEPIKPIHHKTGYKFTSLPFGMKVHIEAWVEAPC